MGTAMMLPRARPSIADATMSLHDHRREPSWSQERAMTDREPGLKVAEWPFILSTMVG
jgi:hypothetical protein